MARAVCRAERLAGAAALARKGAWMATAALSTATMRPDGGPAGLCPLATKEPTGAAATISTFFGAAILTPDLQVRRDMALGG